MGTTFDISRDEVESSLESDGFASAHSDDVRDFEAHAASPAADPGIRRGGRLPRIMCDPELESPAWEEIPLSGSPATSGEGAGKIRWAQISTRALPGPSREGGDCRVRRIARAPEARTGRFSTKLLVRSA